MKRSLEGEDPLSNKKQTLEPEKHTGSLVDLLESIKDPFFDQIPDEFKEFSRDLAGSENPEPENQIINIESEPKPPFKLRKVLCGHKGWVNTVAVEPENQWFASGSNDNTIKVWDVASGKGKITLTGHTMPVQAIAISDRMPYMFSGGMDRTAKCWDLEQNSVIREFHGHMSGVTNLDLHPTLNVVATGCRDGNVHIWDIRSREQIFKLKGHKGTITGLKCRSTDPQIISSSGDATARFWDLRTGQPVHAITSHQNAIGAIEIAANDTLVTASKDSIRKWMLPRGDEVEKIESTNYVHSMSLSPTQVLALTRADGTVDFSNYQGTLKPYQSINTPLMPGSLASESPVLTCTFDRSGAQLITGHSDKTVRIWTESV